MRLETERLILRAPEVRDVEDYLEICNSEFVLHYNAMTIRTQEEVMEQFAKVPSNSSTLVMEHKDTGKVIGAVFTEEDSLRYGVASKELSYFLGECYSRQGYMKEAIHALISHLFETEKLACVAARVFAPNLASRKLLESLGFHADGVIPKCVKGYRDVVFDDVVHSLFREEFRK